MAAAVQWQWNVATAPPERKPAGRQLRILGCKQPGKMA